MHYNFVAGEPGEVRLQVRGFHEQPSVDWATWDVTLLIVDYANTDLLASSSGAVIENEEANGLDITLWDFDIVGTMPADAPAGFHRAVFKVQNGLSLQHHLPHVRSELTVRVWEAPVEGGAEVSGQKTYTQAGHALTVGDWVYRTSGGAWAKAQANASTTLATGLVIGTTTNSVTIFFGGALDYSSHGMGSIGDTLYLSEDTAGDARTTVPDPGNWTQVLGSVTTTDQLLVNIDSGVPS